jgi:hypothetical protein
MLTTSLLQQYGFGNWLVTCRCLGGVTDVLPPCPLCREAEGIVGTVSLSSFHEVEEATRILTSCLFCFEVELFTDGLSPDLCCKNL